MEKKSFSTNINCSEYRTFVRSLTDVQKVAVRSCGFGSLLHFDYMEAPRSVAYLLAKRFYVPTRKVIMDNGSSFELNVFVIHQILGVPLGGWKVRYYASSAEKEIIGDDTGTSTVAPTVDQLFKLVSPELTGDKFVRVFMLISLAVFLCPTSYPRASKHYYSAVACVADIHKYDWSSFILDWLVEGLGDFQKSVAANKKTSTLCGCIFVLVIAYFEYIKAPHIILREDWPRIKIWDNRMIHEYLALEGNSGDDSSFGNFELKDPRETPFLGAQVSSSIFAHLPGQVEDFIQTLPPLDEQSNVRSEIRDMCNNFHREIMTASMSAIQPVVANQLCSMAEHIWNIFQNHAGAASPEAGGRSCAAGTSADTRGAAATSFKAGATSCAAGTSVDTRAAAATSVKVGGRSCVAGTSADTREQNNTEMHTEVLQHRNIQSTRMVSQTEAHAAMDSGINKSTTRRMRKSYTKKRRINIEQDDQFTEIPPETKFDTKLDSEINKTTGGDDSSAVGLDAPAAKDLSDVVKTTPQEDHPTINITDSTSLGTINCAQPYIYKTPSSISVSMPMSRLHYGSHINSDTKGKGPNDSAQDATPNTVYEVVPDSFEGVATRSMKRERKFGIIRNETQTIEINSSSNIPTKKLRVRYKQLDDSKNMSTDHVHPEVLHKTSTSKASEEIVDAGGGKTKESEQITTADKSEHITPADKSPVIDANKCIKGGNATSEDAAGNDDGEGVLSDKFTRRRALKQPAGFSTPSDFFDLHHKRVGVTRSEDRSV